MIRIYLNQALGGLSRVTHDGISRKIAAFDYFDTVDVESLMPLHVDALFMHLFIASLPINNFFSIACACVRL